MSLSYYPFGLQQKGYNDVITSNKNDVAERVKYNGKENNPELGLGWYDFGARNYQASLGRWMIIDPLAEKYMNLSSYNFAMNNPMFFIDPDGKEVDVSTLVQSNKNEDKWILLNLLIDLADISGQTIKIDTDNNGKSTLVGTGCSEGGNCSDEISSYVDHLLTSEESVKVFRSNNSTTTFSQDGVRYIGINGKQIYGAQQALEENGVDSKTFGTGMVFLHETLHTKLGASYFNSPFDESEKINPGFFPDPIGRDRETQTGPTVDRVNQFRESLGLPQRYIYGNVQGTLYFEVDGTRRQIQYEYITVPNVSEADYSKTKLVNDNN
ncbi:RHS repeat-associated core domain-containing protein [Dokdonia ponticola]|uniref:RHS repeat-associated core domain-containing protein n=1 Tax=Dokdonia ponticola TaxID=2041041 RepID=A0ABV9HYN1_9FLAO